MHEKNPRASRWLFPFFREMVERELERRETARTTIPGLEEVVLDEELPESEGQCVHCKCYCFLSQVVATATPFRATCVEHAVKVLGDVGKTLRVRYTDDDLRGFLKKVKNRADKAVTVTPALLLDDGEARKSGRKVGPGACFAIVLSPSNHSEYQLLLRSKRWVRMLHLWLNGASLLILTVRTILTFFDSTDSCKQNRRPRQLLLRPSLWTRRDRIQLMYQRSRTHT
jgi:hypothetical protein